MSAEPPRAVPPRALRDAIHVPNLGPYAHPGVLSTLAVDAEQSGWDGAFIWDHMLHRRPEVDPVVDPWVSLAACAVATKRLRLGALLTPLSRRRPWKVARETATLDLLSGGRLIFAAGLGAPREAEFEAFGEQADDRVRAERLDEALDVLTGLWTGEPFAYDGKHFNLDEMSFLPRPVQRPIPIWIGGNWPNRRPFARAARWDGVVPEKAGGQLPTPEDLRTLIAYVAEQREAAAIDADRPFEVVIGGVTDAPDTAGAELTQAYARAGATWWLERFHPARGGVAGARRRILAGPAV